ncbi:hypothetical protein Ddye_008893 [Dipteronia dyeriana]|uniref:ADP-ribosyl cyclase/cyclic ADP-ribose hydrolase n=1 Tax=Dipteronia dyeriana TaxID=168575 RepID=A0AAE0CLT0_9ROSI|nr:hypothetical protein Ddye_008893 [Dipteronia dyeriana]
MSSSSSSSPSSDPLKYDVFLSFRGEDTRKNITSFLYDALCRKQIETFIDNNELRRGDEISPSLSKAIQDSSLSIIVFSENYASSSWCLNELLEILECMKTRGQIVLPVFYHVTPSDIRKQTGTYKKAFVEHEKRFKKTKDKVRNWRAALTQVANLSGWDFNQHDGTESEFVEKIANDVLKRLNHMSSCDHFDGLVGIVSRIESIESLLCIGIKNIVRIIGIWGMGGIGKTTIARALLIRIANQFEGHCFLANVKDLAKYGPNHLQEKLLVEIFEDRNVHINAFTLNRLRRKKVLIVLDDVDDLDHLDFLVRGHSSFGAGSRIILTSRDKQVLKNGVDELYELKELNYHESLQLFSANAFKQSHPPENYLDLSDRVICYAQGNPLALKVLGRFLFDRSNLEWKSSLSKLKRCPNLKIQNVLRISYDGLDYQEKEIFLSIACFFKGEYKDRVIAVLDNCGLFSEIGIAVLVDKCLLTVTHNLLLMHDLIQEMGRGIVIQESFNEPGKRSRLWDPQDILNLFKKNIGESVVESITLDLSQISDQLHLSHDAFIRLPGLKFLKFYNHQYYEGYKEKDRVQLDQGLELLPDELRYLHWHRYPLKSLPSNFNPDRLVELEMRYSNIEQLISKENKPLENLRRIDLSYSEHLTEAPNTSQVPNLQTMALHGCSSLTKFPRINIPFNIKELYLSFTAIEEIPSAIESLKKLVTLKLDNCTRLKNLPSNIRHLTSLMKLDLRGCSSVTEFPEVSGNVESLLLGETAIEEVPSSVEHLTKLSQLSLRNCTRLKSVSKGIFRLQFMSELSLEGCSKLDKLAIQGDQVVPSSSINELLPRLSRLDMRYCNNIESFPIMFCNLRSLYKLDLAGYSGVDKMLESLPISSLSSFCSLESLNVSECNLLVLPSALSYLPSLTSLDLSRNNFEILSLKPFSSLRSLEINYCERLQSLQDFPLPSRLENFQAHNCISLENLPTANVVFRGNWNSQQKFKFFNCFNLDNNARINIMEDARLRSQLMANNTQGTASTENYPGTQLSSHSLCLPGNEIPKWISDRNEGSSLIIDLPPNWYSNKFFGFITCIVATFEGNSYDSLFFVQWICKFIDHDDESHGILCHVDYETVGEPNSDHVLFATPHRDLFDVYEGGDDIYGDRNTSSLEKFSSCKKALFRFSVVDNELYTLPNCKVKKCGVGLLYAEDIESIQRYDYDNYGGDQTAEIGRDGISNEEEKDPNLEPEVDDEHWNCSFGNCFSFLFQRWS